MPPKALNSPYPTGVTGVLNVERVSHVLTMLGGFPSLPPTGHRQTDDPVAPLQNLIRVYFFRLLGGSWSDLGAIFGALGPIFGALASILAALESILGALRSILCDLGPILVNF